MLDDWFDSFKCTSSDPSRPPRGRKDPISGDTLFSKETKESVIECKKKASYLQDPPLPLDQMYEVILPSPTSTHQLNEHLSRRGESCLESFHLMLAHFGNCGMRTSLADNLNLTGTARHNLAIRHRRCLLTLQNTQRKKTPAAFESIVPHFNHTELHYVNRLAIAAGIKSVNVPFNKVETLPADNGERFFSEYIQWMKTTKPKNDLQDRCCCTLCLPQPLCTAPTPQQQPQQSGTQDRAIVTTTTATTTTTTTINNSEHTESPLAIPTPMTLTNAQPYKQVHQVHEQQYNQQQQQQQTCHPYPYPCPYQNPHQLQCQQKNLFLNMHSPMLPPFPPWAVPNYSMLPQATTNTYCCGRHKHWCNTVGRRGRPPHDQWCHRPAPVEKTMNEK